MMTQEERLLKRVFITPYVMAFILVSACGDDDDSSSDTESDGGNGEDMVSDVSVEVHEIVNTILVVSWSQDVAADEVWLRYTFEKDVWYESPPRDGETGAHEELILGVPGDTEITFQIVSKVGEEEILSETFKGLTGPIPSDFP